MLTIALLLRGQSMTDAAEKVLAERLYDYGFRDKAVVSFGTKAIAVVDGKARCTFHFVTHYVLYDLFLDGNVLTTRAEFECRDDNARNDEDDAFAELDTERADHR